MNKACRSIISPKKSSYSLKKQSGSALILAVFIIIVISLLAASLASLQRDSAEGSSYEIYAARAYLSAYSASEVALAELFAATAADPCDEVTNPPLPSGNAGFYGCNVSNGCTSSAVSTGIDTLYKITSTAICKNNQIITRRQITVGASITVGECVDVYITESENKYSGNYTVNKNLNSAIYVDGDVYISKNVNGNATIYATGDITVEGHVNSSIYAQGNVEITGNVNGNATIYAVGNVTVGGHVNGSIYALGNVEIIGNVNGNATIYATESNKTYQELILLTIDEINDEEITVCWTLAESRTSSASTTVSSADIIYRLQTFN